MVDGEVLLTTLASAPIISNQQCHRMRYSFTWGREERVLRKMWFVFGLIHSSRQSLLMHSTNARSWPRWSSVKASLKLSIIPSIGVSVPLRR